MPKLQDLRQTKFISLPSYEGSQVEIYDSLLVGDIRTVNLETDNQLERILSSLPRFIKSWNFVDEKEQTLPITVDNLGFLRQEDLQFLVEQIDSFNHEIKKKLKP